MSPSLHYLELPGPAAKHLTRRRLAWWEWNATGQAHPSHVVVCVHGLSRQARDFDVLAQALAPFAKVVCVDVAGRGHSDWLADPMAYQVPTYATDLALLLGHLRQQHAQGHAADEPVPELRLDWVGTSMGGLIGLVVAAQATMGIRRLVLNDVGPELQWSALQRIGGYLGHMPVWPSEAVAAQALRAIFTGFGPHTDAQWLALTQPMLRPVQGGLTLHYDPSIAVPFQAMLAATGEQLEAARQAAAAGEAMLWSLYDSLSQPTLLLRGALSDLLTSSTAQAMAQRGPRAQCVTFQGVGHAPTLVPVDQVRAVLDFLLAP